MYHYVYKIKNIKENKCYIGSRSSKTNPEDDIGKLYFSSSKNENFIKDQKDNPKDYRYEVLGSFKTRKMAIEMEIKLHEAFNIPNNPDFYNNARQTSTKFGTYGVIFINGVKYRKEDYYNQSQVKYHSYKKVNAIDINGNIIHTDVDDPRIKNGELKSIQKGKVNAIDKDGRKMTISVDDYYKKGYKCNNTNKVPVRDENGECFLIDKKSPLLKQGKVKHVSTGLVSVVNIESGETMSVTKEEFISSGKYAGVNYKKINGCNNPNSKTIKIYDKCNNVVFTCCGDFKKICRDNGLPFTPLRKSYEMNGRPIFTTKRHEQYAKQNNLMQYTGWYAVVVK